VCQRLLRLDAVTGVWFADVDLPAERTVCRSFAGAVSEYLSDIPDSSADVDTEPHRSHSPVPARQAYDAENPLFINDVFDLEPGLWWRDKALTRGTHTIVAIPIQYESRQFGAIEIHIDRPQGITEEEVDALEALGVIIGHAIGSIQQRTALMAGGAMMLKFQLRSDSVLSRLADVAGAPLTASDIEVRNDGTCSVFVTIADSNATDQTTLAEAIDDESTVSMLHNNTTGTTCLLTLDAKSPVRSLLKGGVALQEIDVDDSGQLTVTVAAPYSIDVREYVDSVTKSTDSVELTAKYEPTSGSESFPEREAGIDGQLTDRQRQTVKLAFYAGYFDWPRQANADTVAEKLGVSQSTFSQHLRAAERKLLAALYN